MRKISNIRLKDKPNARLNAIKSLKDNFGFSLIEAKEKLDAILEAKEIICEESSKWDRVYTILDTNYLSVEHHLKDVVEYDFENTDYDPWNRPSNQPDAETQAALDWYDSLDSEEKMRIKLIGKWQNPPISACG